MQNPVGFLRQIPLFRHLTDTELFDIVRACKRKHHTPNTVLCKEGDASLTMFIIERGSVKVSKRSQFGGEDLQLADLGEGSVIGEMSMIDPAPRSATLTTTQDTVLYEISWSDFEFLKRNGLSAPYKILKEISRELCRRLRETDGKLESFIAKTEQLFVDDRDVGSSADGKHKAEQLKKMFS